MAGRKPFYESAEEMESGINEYFETITTDDGEWKKPPTVTGLALYLGFASRQSMYDYQEKEQFAYPIKRAISRIEQFHEERASYGEKCAGNIFILKNFGWADKIEHTGNQDFNIIWNEQRTEEE